MRKAALGIVLGVTGLAGLGWALAAMGSGPEAAVETVLRLKVASAALEAEAPEGVPFPGPHRALVPLTELRAVLEPGRRQLLGDARDAWGRPLLYWSNGDRLLLLSYGADGVPEVPYVGEAPWSLVPQGHPGDEDADLLVLDGAVWRGPGTSRDNLRRVMADLRSIGTAIESYAIDFSHYPESGGFGDVRALEPTLEPIYIKRLPLGDPWEQSLRAWSIPTEGYALVSYGSDGQPDFPYASWTWSDWSVLPELGTTEPGRDLVFVNGQFVRWPAQLPR